MPKLTNINWTADEYRTMVAQCPPLIRVSETAELVETIFRAQSALPEARHRSRISIYSTCKKAKQRAQIAAYIAEGAKYLSLDISSPSVQAPNPHWPPAEAWRYAPRPQMRNNIPPGVERVPGVVNIHREAHEARAKRDKNMRYTKDEWTSLAHDPEIKELLSRGGFSKATLIDTTMRAQARQLPPERHRVRAEYVVLARRVRSTNLEDQLRKHIKYTPRKVVALPVLSTPPTRLEAATVPTQASPLGATIASPASIPSAAPQSPALAAPMGLLDALRVVAEHFAPKVPSVDEIRSTVQSVIAEQLGLLGQAIDGQVARTVRQTVIAILGDPNAREATAEHDDAQATLPLGIEPHPTQRIRVDVVGMNAPSIAVIKRELNGLGEVLDVHYYEQGHQDTRKTTAPVVVMATKFVSHSTQEKIRKTGARLVFANGGPQSVVEALRGLTH